jgi:hypothetical protein
MSISTTAALPFSSEVLNYNTKQGMPRSLGGITYVQYGASDAVSHAGPSSLFKASAGSQGSLTFPAGFFNWNNGYNPAGLAPNQTASGTRIRCTGKGTLVSSGTDTLTFGAKFTNNAASAQVLVVNADAAALVSITNATTTNTSACELVLDLIVSDYGATGSIITSGLFTYSATPRIGVAPIGIRIPGATASTTVSSYDLTQALTLDIYVTSSATTNSLTMENWIIEVLN